MDMKLELTVLPVSDVDRAKAFYEQVGFRLDLDKAAASTGAQCTSRRRAPERRSCSAQA